MTDNPTHAKLVEIRLRERCGFMREAGLNDDADLDLEAASFLESQASRIEELEAALRAASEVVDVAEKLASCRADDDWIWSVQEIVRAALGGKP